MAHKYVPQCVLSKDACNLDEAAFRHGSRVCWRRALERVYITLTVISFHSISLFSRLEFESTSITCTYFTLPRTSGLASCRIVRYITRFGRDRLAALLRVFLRLPWPIILPHSPRSCHCFAALASLAEIPKCVR